MTLTVTSVETGLLSYIYSEDKVLLWPGGRIETWDAAIVQVTLSDGTVGVGEVAAAIMAAPAVPGIVDALRPYVERLDPAAPAEAAARLRNMTLFWSQGGITNGVIGAVEVALFDAASKREGVPLFALLGGAKGASLQAYASGGLGETVDEVLGWVDDQQEAGFDLIKLRARSELDETFDLVDRVCRSLADGVEFAVDAVQGSTNRPWSEDHVMQVGELVADRGARWFEEPCQATNIAGYSRMVKSLNVAISGVESFPTVDHFRHLVEANGADILQPDVGMVGGVTSFSEVAQLAADSGLGCIPHVWGTGVAMMQNYHVARALENVPLVELCTLTNALRDATVLEPLHVEHGVVELPDTPGLGVPTLAELEDRFPFSAGRGHVIA